MTSGDNAVLVTEATALISFKASQPFSTCFVLWFGYADRHIDNKKAPQKNKKRTTHSYDLGCQCNTQMTLK